MSDEAFGFISSTISQQSGRRIPFSFLAQVQKDFAPFKQKVAISISPHLPRPTAPSPMPLTKNFRPSCSDTW
jgi:hypothetical protein